MSYKTLDAEPSSTEKSSVQHAKPLTQIAGAIHSVAWAIVFFAGAFIFNGTRGDSELIGGAVMLVAGLVIIVRAIISGA